MSVSFLQLLGGVICENTSLKKISLNEKDLFFDILMTLIHSVNV